MGQGGREAGLLEPWVGEVDSRPFHLYRDRRATKSVENPRKITTIRNPTSKVLP
jgi:hypothetical protein